MQEIAIADREPRKRDELLKSDEKEGELLLEYTSML